MPYTHLHNHSEYSLLDGAIRLDRLIETAVKMKMSSLALTDHGNMFGAIEFYKGCQRLGIKPIIGVETYIAPGSRFNMGKEETGEYRVPESSFHLILLATNYEGYRNLINLVSHAYLEGFYYKPRIDRDLLSQHAKGLIGLSACLKGEIPYFVQRDQPDRAQKALASYLDILGRDNFYLELMELGLKNQRTINDGLLKLAREFDVPIVATNDCHYLTEEDYLAHDVLLCIQTRKVLADKERLRFETKQAYFRSAEEMTKLFQELPEAISNTQLIAERCNLMLNIGSKDVHLPNFPRPQNYASDFDYIRYLAAEGLQNRFPRPTKGMEDRLEYELEIIHKSGLAGYFLVVKEIVDFARSKDIPVGPGRGSAVGSLVLYSLGITDVDPLKYGLIFERFLNPERVSLPDIDIDFGDTRREEVIDFISKRYGEKNVTQIITFGTMQAKAVLRDVGRVLSIPYGEVDRLAKLMPMNQTIDEAMNLENEFKKEVLKNQQVIEMIEIAKRLEGLARHASLHAAGVVIAPRELTEYMPLYKNPEKGEVSSQYDKDSLEEIGLIKMDILGLRTLTVIDETIRKVNLDRKKISLDDKETYALLQEGKTTSVFQLESRGMRDILRSLKPENFEDLIAVIAIYRPGPLGTMNMQKLIENKHNPQKIDYYHPLLADILRETHGIIIYQEQVMKIANVIAGFSMAEADTLRRAMGKKMSDLMEAMKEKFIEGARQRKLSAEMADRIFEMIAPFAGYGFNKSHAAAYALLAYQTAFLKTHYPVEFMLSSLTSEINDTDRIGILVKEARRMAIDILPPDINLSSYEFTSEPGDNPRIRYGLGAIKNVGRPAFDEIDRERRKGAFKGFYDFVARINHSGAARIVNKKCIESLVKAGTYDTLTSNRARLLKELEARAVALENQTSLFEAGAEFQIKEWTRLDKIGQEKEVFGFYFSGHPLEKYEEEYRSLKLTPISAITEQKRDRAAVTIGGVIVSAKIKRDKKNKEYAIFLIEDFDGMMEIIVFSDLFSKSSNLIKKDIMIIVKGRMDSGMEDKAILRAEEIIPFSECRRLLRYALIHLNSKWLDEKELLNLQDILAQNPGETEIWLRITDDKGVQRTVRSNAFKITPRNEVIEAIRKITGEDGVELSEVPPPLPSRNNNYPARKTSARTEVKVSGQP